MEPLAPQQPLLLHLNKFLGLHWDGQSPLIVACSGGPDSKALLCLLLECPGLKLHVAHVDHGWRKESSEEAKALQDEVEKLGLPFYCKQLEMYDKSENTARNLRYAFLEDVRAATKAQAILLGHQREDQAETILKRIFEGASLTACQGMRPIAGSLWRPLLSTPKQDLINFLKNKEIPFIQDATNESPEYLRGRMRKQIFPWLEEMFGKNIVKNLCLLGERMAKLEEALENQAERISHDATIPLSELQLLTETALEYFLKKWTAHHGTSLSLDQLSLLVRMVQTDDRQKRVATSSHTFQVEAGRLALKKNCHYREVGRKKR